MFLNCGIFYTFVTSERAMSDEAAHCTIRTYQAVTNTTHDTCSRHSDRRRLHRRPVRRRLCVGTQGRQCRILHRQPADSLVHGRTGHDRRRHFGRDLHFSSWIGRRRLLLLHADGAGIHGRAVGRRLRVDPALLPAQGRVAL